MKIARNERGFTLIELMVVLIIIGIIAAIAIPVMSKQTDKANNKRALAEIKSMKTAIDIWVSDPTVNTGGLKAPNAVTTTNTGDIRKVLDDAGISLTTNDPWGTPYHYICKADNTGATSTASYIILSYGPDKALTGSDNITATNLSVPKEGQTADATGLADVALHD